MDVESENVSYITKNKSDVSSIFGDDKSEWTTRYGEVCILNNQKK